MSSQIDELLRSWTSGEPESLAPLMAAVYDELRRVAVAQMRRERDGHTLQPTAVVHEVFLRLAGDGPQWRDRSHFFSIAARTMRRVLIDHARAHAAEKRGAGAFRVTLADFHAVAEPGVDLLALDQALEELARLDSQQAEMVELYHYGGLTLEEVAQACQVPVSTVHRRLGSAKAFLRHRLKGDG